MTTGDRRKFNECRLLGVKQKILVGPWLNGKHLPHVKAFTVDIVKRCMRQTKQVSGLHFYFHLLSTSAAWMFQSFKIQWKLILNHSASSNIKMVFIFWFISSLYGFPPNNYNSGFEAMSRKEEKCKEGTENDGCGRAGLPLVPWGWSGGFVWERGRVGLLRTGGAHEGEANWLEDKFYSWFRFNEFSLCFKHCARCLPWAASFVTFNNFMRYSQFLLRWAGFSAGGFKNIWFLVCIVTIFACIIHDFLEQILRMEEILCILSVLIYLDNDLFYVRSSSRCEILQEQPCPCSL